MTRSGTNKRQRLRLSMPCAFRLSTAAVMPAPSQVRPTTSLRSVISCNSAACTQAMLQIEYGAGFGQTALALARLGVQVYAVDINPMFNAAVAAQAEFFSVPLYAISGRFGDNPRPGLLYNAILFYEAFHHCPDARVLVEQLRHLISPGGIVLMAGEPIATGGDSVPYPWGMRLDAETVAVVRWRHWFELGFQEDYLVRMFIANGFVWTKYPCAMTHYGDAHAFRPRPPRIYLATYSIPSAAGEGWFAPETTGRWTAKQAHLPIDASGRHTHIRFSFANYHSSSMTCTLSCGGQPTTFQLDSQRQAIVSLACVLGTRTANITCAYAGAPSLQDSRVLGIFLQWFEYMPQ